MEFKIGDLVIWNGHQNKKDMSIYKVSYIRGQEIRLAMHKPKHAYKDIYVEGFDFGFYIKDDFIIYKSKSNRHLPKWMLQHGQ